MTATELKALAKTRQAEEDLTDFQSNGVRQFKNDIGQLTDMDKIYKRCKQFVWKREQIRSILNPGTGKKGRPSKQE